MLFLRFYTLLCALVTIYTTYDIYFFLIHQCTNSLSSLHISFITAHLLHHCTLKQALHEVTRATAAASLLYVSPSWWDFTLAREYLSLITVLVLPCWTNSHHPKPGLNVVIKPYKLVLLPTASMDKVFLVIGMQFSIGKMIRKEDKIRLPCTQLVEPVTIFVSGGRNCAP